jgi:hypothetical protein
MYSAVVSDHPISEAQSHDDDHLQILKRWRECVRLGLGPFVVCGTLGAAESKSANTWKGNGPCTPCTAWGG